MEEPEGDSEDEDWSEDDPVSDSDSEMIIAYSERSTASLSRSPGVHCLKVSGGSPKSAIASC